MNIILKNSSIEYIIKKSKFICSTFYVENEEQIKDFLMNINSKYNDATHNCYAYVVGSKVKAFDDGEPNGTAGIPILKVLKKKELTNILVIITRYFGGIKLGAGGLIRAYSKATVIALNDSNITNFIDFTFLTLEAFYDDQKLLDILVKDVIIEDKLFNDKIIYKIKIASKDKNDFINKFLNTNIKIVPN